MPAPVEHIVVAGDTLSALAQHYYGISSEHAWKAIYEANKGAIGADPNLIKPGEKLVLPPLLIQPKAEGY